MELVNLTPHDVDICDIDGNVIRTYEASGKIARVKSRWVDIGKVDDVPIVLRQNEKVIDLPEPQENTMHIVSNIVLDYCQDRSDLLAPVKQVKVNGRVIGCRAFAGRS